MHATACDGTNSPRSTISDFALATESEHQTRYREPRNLWKDPNLLTLDGGGIRGYWSLCVLRRLMDHVMEFEKCLDPPAFSSTSSPLWANSPPGSPPVNNHHWSRQQYRPCHYFDYICGVSLGGISAIMLGVMRFSVDEAIDRSKRILTGLNPRLPRLSASLSLSGARANNSRRLKENLVSELLESDDEEVSVIEGKSGVGPRHLQRGSTALLRAKERMCQSIVFTTQKARKGVQRPYALRSYRTKSPSLRYSQADTSNIPLVDACRASLASPSSFESVKIDGLDGRFRDASLSDVDPAIEAYYEISDLQADGGGRIQSLLSIGSPVGSWSDPKARMKYSQARQEVTDRLLEQHAREEGFYHDRLADPTIFEELSDDPREAFDEVGRMATKFCVQGPVLKNMQTLARRLVECRRSRSQTAEWNRFAGLKTPCGLCGHDKDYFPTRYDPDELYEHLREKHGVEL